MVRFETSRPRTRSRRDNHLDFRFHFRKISSRITVEIARVPPRNFPGASAIILEFLLDSTPPSLIIVEQCWNSFQPRAVLTETL